MRCRVKYLLSVLILIAFCVTTAQSQRDSAYVKPSPYDLISSYYDNGFSPFRKGNKYLGLALSLQDQSLTNTQRLLDKVVSGNRLNFNVEMKGGYFIGDYTQVGVNLTYEQSKFQGVTVREGDTVQVDDIFRGLTAIPYIKPYFPVTKNQRLSFFMELGVGLGGGQGVLRETRNLDEISKTYTEQFTFSMGLTPGVTFFAIENFAFEIGINVLGYQLRRVVTTINEVERAVDLRHNVNLQLNLLSLNLGLAYYF